MRSVALAAFLCGACASGSASKDDLAEAMRQVYANGVKDGYIQAQGDKAAVAKAQGKEEAEPPGSSDGSGKEDSTEPDHAPSVARPAFSGLVVQPFPLRAREWATTDPVEEVTTGLKLVDIPNLFKAYKKKFRGRTPILACLEREGQPIPIAGHRSTQVMGDFDGDGVPEPETRLCTLAGAPIYIETARAWENYTLKLLVQDKSRANVVGGVAIQYLMTAALGCTTYMSHEDGALEERPAQVMGCQGL